MPRTRASLTMMSLERLPRPCLSKWQWIGLLSSFVMTGYGLGFAVFVGGLPTPFTTPPSGLQGLAVFTGGAGRVETALRLVQNGFRGPVLISGINPTSRLVDMEELAGLKMPLDEGQRAQVMLDGAQTTKENLQSLNLWATTTEVSEVGVITSTYHAARVKLLGWLWAPKLKLIVMAVQPEDTRLRVLWREYHKLLLAPFLR
jgi:uncharacterized SAM-binding protein YcdF (DUF218 family)